MVNFQYHQERFNNRMTKRIRKYTKYSGTQNKEYADDLTFYAYSTWRCVQLHFTTEKYCMFKYHFKTTNSSRDGMNKYFLKKELKFGNRWCPERTILHQIGRYYDATKEKKLQTTMLGVYDVWSYFIYQFTRDRIYLQDMHEDGFKEWLDKVDMFSWENHFKKDMDIVLQNLEQFKECDGQIVNDGYGDFQTLFTTDGVSHPKIFKLYLGGDISIETILLMDSVLGFMKNINKSINDISGMWDEFYLKSKKYAPLLFWIFGRNVEYATENPISNVYPSEYYQTLDIKEVAKKIMKDVICPVYEEKL